MDRRQTLTLLGGAAVAVLGGGVIANQTGLFSGSANADDTAESFEIEKTPAEWREILTDDQFAILREEKTERAFSSPLDKEYRDGMFHCAGCDLPVYSSDAKYDSGTGWPSFYQSLPDAVRTKPDNSLFATRTEVHCRRCGGHFGHIFDDGPEPTGKRHCLNGLALTFKPATA